MLCQITLWVTPPVIAELDEHKYSTKENIRKQARQSIKLLKRCLDSDGKTILQNNTLLKIKESEDAIEKKNEQNVDNEIIMYVRSIESSTSEDTFVVTHDMGLQVKLNTQKIISIEPPEHHLLKNEKS